MEKSNQNMTTLSIDDAALNTFLRIADSSKNDEIQNGVIAAINGARLYVSTARGKLSAYICMSIDYHTAYKIAEIAYDLGCCEFAQQLWDSIAH